MRPIPGDADTIVAPSSPAGASWRAVVRLSGTASLAIADRLFDPADPGRAGDTPGFRFRVGRLKAGGLAFPAVLYVMRAPRSYTREDVVEFHVPGAVPIVRAVLEACLAEGARAAGPGEFTRRAFRSGRLDLAQAEAVGRLVRARDEAGRRRSIAVLAGGLSQRIRAAIDAVQDVQALLVAAIDFSDQDLGDEVVRRAAARLEAARSGLDAIPAAAFEDAGGDRGIRVLLVGGAGAGKSALFNSLLGRDAAIVSGVPGTTRDVLEGEVDLEGIRFVLVDTAGVRDDGEARSSVDRAAERRSVEAREGADALLHVVDGARASPEAVRRIHASLPQPRLLAVNKVDLPGCDPARFEGADLALSAETGEGLAALRERLVEVATGAEGEAALVLSARQAEAIRRARGALEAAAAALARSDLGPAFASLDVETAIGALGEIVGEVTTEDVLDRVFGTFCIGK